jgi:hypothetical protein
MASSAVVIAKICDPPPLWQLKVTALVVALTLIPHLAAEPPPYLFKIVAGIDKLVGYTKASQVKFILAKFAAAFVPGIASPLLLDSVPATFSDAPLAPAD